MQIRYRMGTRLTFGQAGLHLGAMRLSRLPAPRATAAPNHMPGCRLACGGALVVGGVGGQRHRGL